MGEGFNAYEIGHAAIISLSVSVVLGVIVFGLMGFIVLHGCLFHC